MFQKNKDLEETLEPCIFCERKKLSILKGASENSKINYWVVCMYSSCGAEGGMKNSAKQAANLWNKISKQYFKNIRKKKK